MSDTPSNALTPKPTSQVVDGSPHPFPSNQDTNHSCNGPRRYIYTQVDMEHFRHSSARKELLSFVTAMGRGLTTNNGDASTSQNHPHSYDPTQPLAHLTPALASLHGSLSCMADTWMDGNHPDGIPPDREAKARFGNPAFRSWHARLVKRSYGIVKSCLDCHRSYCNNSGGDNNLLSFLVECSKKGYRAASNESSDDTGGNSHSSEEETVEELRAYLHDSFGHPVRIDYGTGHESSFVVFLLALCKIGCFVWRSDTSNDSNDLTGDDGNTSSRGSQIKPASSPHNIRRASLSLLHVYLSVTRGLQRDYMLEPAGSHGVWGLDDYHCIPFYVGACQLVAREQWQQHRLKGKKQSGQMMIDKAKMEEQESDGDIAPNNPYLPEKAFSEPKAASLPLTNHSDNMEHWDPSIIHNRQALEAHRQTYLYFSCIHFIQQIKPNVPFFESSPMLNDISSLGNWTKVSSGLLRLYEGEVLDKLPVVQHFVFGKIFSANWSPSKKGPVEAPKWTFINGPMGDECIAPWAYGNSVNDHDLQGGDGIDNRVRSGGNSGHPGGMAPTRAPWAK